jgi:predicted lipoprotein
MSTRARLIPVLCLLSGLASCVPWTIRPIRPPEAAPAVTSPAAYVESIWEAELLPSIINSAVDARELLDAIAASPAEALKRYGRRDAGGPPYYVVKGKGTVTAVDTQSRAGLAFVDVEPLDGRPDLSIQVGPVLRGTALRDATGVIRFSDFVNQLQYADAGNELNNRVLNTILAPVDKSRLDGRMISFTGALAALEESEPPLAGLVPVQLMIEARQ